MISTSKIVQIRTISRPRIRSVVAIALVGLAAPAALAAGPAAVARAAPASTPCAAVPDGVTLVVGTASGYAVARASGVENHAVALAEPATKAVRTADGSVWVEMGHGEATSVARVLASGEAVVGAAPEARLSGVGWIGGRPAVAIVDADESHAWRGDSDAYGAVLVEFTDGTQVDVAPAGGPEYGVGSATIGDGRVLVGAFSDLAEVFRSFDIDGNELSGVFSPTDRAPYNDPPLYLWPAAAADTSGSTWLSWVEGPDANGVTGEVVDRWALVVADATTGQERLRLDLGDPGSALLHADFDGRTWVGTFDTSEAADAVGQPGRVRRGGHHGRHPDRGRRGVRARHRRHARSRRTAGAAAGARHGTSVRELSIERPLPAASLRQGPGRRGAAAFARGVGRGHRRRRLLRAGHRRRGAHLPAPRRPRGRWSRRDGHVGRARRDPRARRHRRRRQRDRRPLGAGAGVGMTVLGRGRLLGEGP